jgi:hypothetical protein
MRQPHRRRLRRRKIQLRDPTDRVARWPFRGEKFSLSHGKVVPSLKPVGTQRYLQQQKNIIAFGL